MATHSYAYIPLEKENQFLFCEGWSDGDVAWTGLYWFNSLLCWKETLRATILLGGSPCWVLPEEVIIKEEDYFTEGILEALDNYDEDDFININVQEDTDRVLKNLNERKFDEAWNSWLGSLSLADHIRLGTGLNMHICHSDNKEALEHFTPTKTLSYTETFEKLSNNTLEVGTMYVLGEIPRHK